MIPSIVTLYGGATNSRGVGDEIENDAGICEDETAKKDEVGEFYSQPTSPLSSSLSLISGTNSPDLSITLNETEYVEEDILFYEVR